MIKCKYVTIEDITHQIEERAFWLEQIYICNNHGRKGIYCIIPNSTLEHGVHICPLTKKNRMGVFND